MTWYHRVRYLTKLTIALIAIVTAVAYYVTSAQNSSTHPAATSTTVRTVNTQARDSAATINIIKYPPQVVAAKNDHESQPVTGKHNNIGEDPTIIKLAVVACGSRTNQTMVTLKSAAALSKRPLHLIILADDENRIALTERLLDWPSSILKRISFEILPIRFPDVENADSWKKLFKLCAAQRLFFPSVLPEVDSLLYVDTDVIFLRPVEDIWNFFGEMNSSHIAGLSPEHEDYATGWYNRFAHHPYYEPLGVNSGVMLMNLTRMRSFRWQEYLQPIFKEYKLKIVWGDQDIINIIFHYHPDKLFIFSCEWNYRPDHCMYTSVCKKAENNGIAFLHGNRGVFHNDKQPAFKAVYNVMEKYSLGTDIEKNLLLPLKDALKMTENTNCGKLHQLFTKNLERMLWLQRMQESNQQFEVHSETGEKLEL